jgi:hypothetical protein
VEQREKGPSALREGAAWEEADHAGNTSEQTLHAGEGAGKREHPNCDLAVAGSSGGAVPRAGMSGREDRSGQEVFLGLVRLEVVLGRNYSS